MRHLLLILVLFAVPVLCSAEVYKWVDEKGATGYSDDLSKVPEKYRNNAIAVDSGEQAVEILENSGPVIGDKKEKEVKKEQEKDLKGQEKGKEQRAYDGKAGEVWKQDFARQKHQIKSLEEQATGLKERMADGNKKSRGEYLTLQNTLRDLNVRIEKAKGKLDSLNETADKADVPAEFR